MIDILFLLVLCLVLIQNAIPLLAAGSLIVCICRGAVGWLASKRKFLRLEIAIILCIGYWLANYEWSTHSFNNLVSFQFLRRDGALLVTYPAFFFFLHWRLRRAYFRAFWFSFLTALSLMAACAVLILRNFPYISVLEHLNLVGGEAEFEGSRLFYGWYQAHDTAGGIYTMACLILLAFLIEGKMGRHLRLFVWGLLFSCLAGLALTYSRSGYLGFMAGALVLFPIRQLRRSFKIGLVLAVPLIVVLLSSSSFLSRIDTITDPNWGTNATRFVLWQDAWYDFSQSPIVGIGFGRYNDLRRQFQGVPGLVYIATGGEIENNDSTAHDSYLHFLAEGGVVGLFVTMFIWWCAWKELTFYERKLPRSHLHPFHRASKGTLSAMLVYCIFDHVLGSGSNVLFLMTLIGLTLAASRAELATLSKVRPQTELQAVRVPAVLPIAAGQTRF
ncbi:MAG TPA: O-antigen ligase family protein [Terriglobia bacterium]|nr:O-antigen ligase family protein [Terriglobia bacterium]